jgi:hypothetical protein
MQFSRFFAGLRLSFGTHYRLEGKSYIAGYDEERVVALMRNLVASSHQATRLDWLLSHRDAIREIDSLKTRAFLSYTISTSSDDRVRRLAIWLRGRCGGYVGNAIVARFAVHNDASIRKEVARSLKRLSAWVALRAMATYDPNPRIRAIASQPAIPSHSRRQSRFLENVEALRTSSAETPLRIASSVTFTEGRPARPNWLIRQILTRIHALVTGA